MIPLWTSRSLHQKRLLYGVLWQNTRYLTLLLSNELWFPFFNYVLIAAVIILDTSRSYRCSSRVILRKVFGHLFYPILASSKPSTRFFRQWWPFYDILLNLVKFFSLFFLFQASSFLLFRLPSLSNLIFLKSIILMLIYTLSNFR